MPDDHSKVVPLLPIPNRTVKRLCADDSADARVKVGHRQALTAPNTPTSFHGVGVLVFLGGENPVSRQGSMGLLDVASACRAGRACNILPGSYWLSVFSRP